MSTTEMQPASMTQSAVSELSQFNEMIAGIIHYGDLTVEANGIGQVEEAHKAVKKLNASIEKKRKELKAGALEYGRTVDSIAKQLTEKVDSVEAKLKAERDAFDAIEKAEKAAEEAAKLAAKQGRLDAMVSAGILVDLVAADLPDEEWMWWFSKAKKEAEAKRQAIEEERLHNERRQKLVTRIARMEALGVVVGSVERVEQLSDAQFEDDYATAKKFIDDRRAAEEAEQKRQTEELRLRAAELEAERKTLEAERAARLKADAETAAAERQKLESEREELRRQQEAIRQAAEAKAKAERETAEQARLEALKPEIEKAHGFAQCMITDALDSLVQLGSPSWGDDAMHTVRNCGATIVAMVSLQ